MRKSCIETVRDGPYRTKNRKWRKIVKLLLYITLVGIVLVSSSAICLAVENEQVATEKDSKYPIEHWFNLTMMGMKIGYVHQFVDKTVSQGEEMIRSKTSMVMQFSGGGNDIRVENNRIEYSDSNFMPRYFVYTSDESGEKRIEGKIKDGTAYITTTINGETTESEVAIPPDTISDSVAVDSLLSKNLLKVGAKLPYQTFNIDVQRIVTCELSVSKEDTLTYQSEEKQVYVLENQVDIMGGITVRLWVDSEGTTYKFITDMPGLSVVATKTDSKTALGEIEALDIVLRTRIIPSGKMPRKGAKRFVANVQHSGGNLAEIIKTNNQQILNSENGNSGTLTIEKAAVDEKNCPKLPIQSPELEKYLSSTVYVESEHPDIHAQALEVIDGEDNSWLAAKKLSKWVYKSIDEKGLSGGYSTSLSTLKTLSGDCTEHTVLLIAMARSVGIPARICAGLVFAKDAFYYHFWPEVYVGTWVQIDPTFGQVVADANHILLQGGMLESGTMVEYTEGVFSTLNQLEIDIVE